MASVMDMYKHIWDDRNLFVHGASLKETQPKKNVNTWEDKSHKFIAPPPPPPPHTHTHTGIKISKNYRNPNTTTAM
jgi:hypothetical protein